MPFRNERTPDERRLGVCLVLVAAAALTGSALLIDAAGWSSATYDEVTYLRVAARWWRTGQQAAITRMGSPLLFWKLQQAPVLWVLDMLGRSELIDDPLVHQAELLPLVRIGSVWIWLAALGVCSWWSLRLYGPRAMALAAWLFALSPNLIAHGGLVTMELPLVLSSSLSLFSFWCFLRNGRNRWLWMSSAFAGIAFACKFTAILIPPILTIVWLGGLRRSDPGAGVLCHARRVMLGMSAFVLVMMLADFAVNGFAIMPLSPTHGAHPSITARFGRRPAGWLARAYELPLPQDWIGFAIQTHHQMSGGPSYLLGERRMQGWRYYYFVALAVKVPLGFWLLLVGRVVSREGVWREPKADAVLPLFVLLFLAVTALGSTRNYGFRYLLPLAPLAIVWVSRLAETSAGLTGSPGWRRCLLATGLTLQALAVAGVHPDELTYFNIIAGGPVGGRRVLSDSNLDWGQGLRSLRRLQQEEPAFRDLTLYYFGDTDPAFYGVQGVHHTVSAVSAPGDTPALDQVRTRYVAVSASLQWGPWGPPGLFRELDRIRPVRLTDDTTIAIYRADELRRFVETPSRKAPR
jgi:hypothetical protein